MKQWIICKYGAGRSKIPEACEPIGIAVQKTFDDAEEVNGFINISDLENFCTTNGLCAFSDGYKKFFDAKKIRSIPQINIAC